MATEYTPNYNLDKYVGTDKPNLRDQYNSAMDKIDAQFVVVENQRTDQANQISAINTNITQLGQRVDTAEQDIQTLTTTVSGIPTDIQSVRETAENALSLATTNESNIATLDGEMDVVQQGVTNLTGITKSLTLFDANNMPITSWPAIIGTPAYWEETEIVANLTSAIPDWANYLEIQFDLTDDYYATGASSSSNYVSFAHDSAVKRFPLNEYYNDGGTIKTRRVNKFSLCVNTIGTQRNGMAAVRSMYIPFVINGTVLTQKGMGIAISEEGSATAPFTNGLLGVQYTFEPNTSTPVLNNASGIATINKIVARA